MKFNFLYAFLLVIIFSLAAFAQTDELKGKWFLKELTSDGKTIDITPEAPLRKKLGISFETSDRFGLATPCNGVGGNYTLGKNGKFKAGSVIGTKMYCEGVMEIEEAMVNAVSKATRYEIKNGNLTLRDQNGMNVMRFSRTDATGNNSDSKELTLYVNNKKVDCRAIVPMKCFQVRESDDRNWRLLYDRIEDFKFQKGFYYVLRVKRTRIQNPPKDTSGVRYELVEIVKKTKKFVKG